MTNFNKKLAQLMPIGMLIVIVLLIAGLFYGIHSEVQYWEKHGLKGVVETIWYGTEGNQFLDTDHK